jgi:chromate transport protein ChrA
VARIVHLRPSARSLPFTIDEFARLPRSFTMRILKIRNSVAQKDLVEERNWVSRSDYLEGLAFSQLSPGPLAAQLAMYIGWLRAGFIGSTLVGVAFVLPSFLMAVAVAALYVHFGSLPWIQGMFYGIGAAVIAIIVRSTIKLVRTTVNKDWLLWIIFAALAITTAWTQSESVWLARRSLVDIPTVTIGALALCVLMLTKKIPEPVMIVAAGVAGLLLHGRG